MHRWSKLFVPTLREAPADAEVASHKFLVRAGYVRQLGAGIYNYLFLGQRSINKIIAIVREEMDKIGQEFLLPGIMPAEIWEQSGRWTTMGQNMFRLKDRKGADLCLGMTHEEVMTDIARKELRSYKQLPQIWYQIQTKFRDEPRPKSGLLRVRQFTMKDSYSFDIGQAGLDKSYDLHDKVYRSIFSRCGLSFVAVEADSGSMGGSQSQEFMVYTDAGEDLIASCASCGYAANIEKAVSTLAAIEDIAPTGDGTVELVHTPGKGAIADVSEFLNISPAHDIKTLIFVAARKASRHNFDNPELGEVRITGGRGLQYVVALLRGDHTLNETKLGGVLVERGWDLFSLAEAAEIQRRFDAPVGYLGPVDLKWNKPDVQCDEPIIIMDKALENRRNLVAGANKLDHHFRNVVPGRDFNWTVAADIRNVSEGEACPECGSPLKVAKAVEIGHIFKLGYKYTESMGARVLDPNGKEVAPIMGSYGIGIERILTSSIEQSNDANGFWLPPSIAPFEVVVTITNVADQNLLAAGNEIAEWLEAAGFDVLLDDRDERAGVKFKDADLVGIPFRVNVGKKAAEGKVELVTRATASSQDIAITDVVSVLKQQTSR